MVYIENDREILLNPINFLMNYITMI